MRVGQYEAALAAYSRAADLAPGIAGYRLRQAELLFQNSKTADADSMMRGVVRKNPNFAGAGLLCMVAVRAVADSFGRTAFGKYGGGAAQLWRHFGGARQCSITLQREAVGTSTLPDAPSKGLASPDFCILLGHPKKAKLC